MAPQRRKATLSSLGEFGFLASVLGAVGRGRGVRVGPGQDCAVVKSATRSWLLTIDSLVEGVHFRRQWLTPYQLGGKSFAINASDIAAMGGVPRYALVNLAVPAEYPVRSLQRLQSGIVRAAHDYGAAVVGGNLTGSAQLSVTIALVGECPERQVTRAGARPGDHLFVTGTLGDAALAVARLQQRRPVPPAVLHRFSTPAARVQAGQTLVQRGWVSAMIDVSDGLLQDLGHLCEQSDVAAWIAAGKVPRSRVFRRLRAEDRLALAGGEDYELLCAVPPRFAARLRQMRRVGGCPITEIGQIVTGRGVRVVDSSGRLVRIEAGGYDHFASRSQAAPVD
jgi:thiamine-monophosphate kinase